MILVHRLRGEPMFINEDLIESIEATPDTVLTLVDGRKIVVADPPQMIVDRARVYRASVLAATDELRSRSEGGEVLQFPVAGAGVNSGANSGANSDPKAESKAGSRASVRRPVGGDR
ncbi:MAG: flagellar protein FlbD [Actinomycetota bacterium]|nr:flagellar protein FlbD [Actinomycetota bacterium]